MVVLENHYLDRSFVYPPNLVEDGEKTIRPIPKKIPKVLDDNDTRTGYTRFQQPGITFGVHRLELNVQVAMGAKLNTS